MTKTHDSEVTTYRRWLVAIAVIALAIRLLHVTSLNYLPVSDMAGYLDNARSLATGKGLQWTTLFPPGTMWFLWLLGQFFNLAVPLPILMCQAAFDTASVLLVADVARRLFSKQTALAAALLYAIYRTAVLSTGVVMSETLGSFSALCAVDVFLVYMTYRRLWLLLTVAVTTAWSVYVRVNALPMPFVFVVWMLLFSNHPGLKGPSKRTLTALHCFIFLSAVMVAFVPWSIRNTRIAGHLSFISNNGPMNLLMSNNVSGNGGWFPLENIQDPEVQKAVKLRSEQEEGRLASRFLLSHPIYEIFYLVPERIEGLFFTAKPSGPGIRMRRRTIPVIHLVPTSAFRCLLLPLFFTLGWSVFSCVAAVIVRGCFLCCGSH